MKKSTKLALALALAVGIGGGTLWWLKKPGAPRVTYVEAAVTRGDVAVSILATGTVQPKNRLELKAPIAGRMERVLVQEGAKVKRGQILAWMSSTERAALVDAARSQGAEELQKWEDLYRPTPILAPITGTVILRSVEPGQTFTTTDAILVMSDRLTVKALVDETDVAQVKLKQPAEIILDAYSSEKIAAEVDQIAFEAKTTNNVTTYQIDVAPKITPEFMRAGMTANVNFILDTRANALLVPNEALQTATGAPSVLVRGPEGKPVPRAIETGITDGKSTEVLSGLTESEIVLIPQRGSTRTSSGSNPFFRAPGRGRR